ncbi:MAG TPA: ABC transporter ATP-binding protein [Anaeromyxobacter sp.]
MIDVDRLTFDYPGTRALHGVSFQLAPGSITALVGPNGAGKTTLLRCLAALEEPLEGAIRIDGVDALAEPRAAHRRLGYLSDFFGVYDDLTVEQCLRHAAALREIPAGEERAAVRRAADRLGILDRLPSRAGELSRGLRQRLAIGQAIVHQPRMLLLDEPASGLDPDARHALAALFLRLRNEGMTLLVSSHILAELDAYSTDMLVLRDGRVVSHEPLAGSRARPAGPVTVTIELAEPFAGVVELLRGIEGVSGIRVEGLTITAEVPGDVESRHRVLRLLVEAGAPVCAFGGGRRSMEEAYLATVAARRGKGA